MMEYASVAADPFSILTVVVAPAVLTNASSVLALGTNNRLARVADRTHAVTAQLAKLEPGSRDHQVSTAGLAALQTRAQLLLRALRCFYLGLGLFASSALISIAGFYRDVLQSAMGIPDSSWNRGRVWSFSGHRAGLRLCTDDSRNAACSQRLSLRSRQPGAVRIAELQADRRGDQGSFVDQTVSACGRHGSWNLRTEP
jgi:hypothetical protein